MKCPFFLFKTNDRNDELKKSEMSVFDRPTLEEIRSWGKSFDILMRSPAGRKVFRDFLRCEYSEENILFWLACEELKVETNAEKVEEKARFIYEDYISILSPKEVSIFAGHSSISSFLFVPCVTHNFVSFRFALSNVRRYH